MAGQTPLETVELLVEAFETGDVDAALDLYEPDAILRAEPESQIRGHEELREAVAGFAALRPRFTTYATDVMQAGDLALYTSSWSLTGTAPDGTAVHQEGKSTDVLRRGTDGTWRIAIDNPIERIAEEIDSLVALLSSYGLINESLSSHRKYSINVYLLKAISRAPEPMVLNELCDEVGLSKPTAHRILSALTSE